MRNLLFSLLCIIGLLSCSKKKLDINATEILIPLHDRLNKIKFLDQKTGFIVGGQQFSHPAMLKTIDGGATWYDVHLPSNNEQKEIYGFDFLKDGKIITVGYGGTIYISSDTGNSFQYVQHSAWNELKDVIFKSNDSALIIGGIAFNRGHISRFKADGSGTIQVSETLGFELCDIDMPDLNTVYYAGYGAILKSVDGGLTHNFTTAKNDFFKAMCWKNSNEGIAVGYEGSILRTNNGGASWQFIRNGNDMTKKKIHFLDVERNSGSRVVAVAEGGVVFVSADDGLSWKEAVRFTSNDLHGITFRDDQTCFVVGDNGCLFNIGF
ncbi:MAG: hypothetical protein K9I70_00135 [Chitinophagaceae bacterium]|nr:hypothetical protein [Chitinophagaceae bacterium]